MSFQNLDFGVRVLFFAFSEIRLHLSIAFESQLSSLCIRFAQTLKKKRMKKTDCLDYYSIVL